MRTAMMLMCVCYVLWRPVSNGAILYPLLGVLAILSASRLVTGERSVFRLFAVAAYLLVIAGLVSALVGSIYATPGLTQQLIVWFGTIVIWGLWAASLTRESIRLLLRVICIATAALSGLIVVYIGSQQGLLPNFVPESLLRSQDAGFDVTADGSAIRLLGLSTLAAAGPLVSSALFAGRDTFLPSRKLLAVATVLSVLAAVLAGRRAIAALTIVSPLLTYLVVLLLRPRARTARRWSLPRAWVMALPLLFIALLATLRFSLLERPLTAVGDGLHLFFSLGGVSNSLKSAGDLVREQQGDKLLGAWGDRPLLGHGMGAVLPDRYTRSADRPWMFELQYHDLLFTSGVVGGALVLAALVCVCIGLRRAAAVNPEHVPTLVATSVGALSMLIANASNPYLQAVGHGWSVALVLGVANALLRPRPEPADPAVHPVMPVRQTSQENRDQPLAILTR